ncbi:unnamed protein product [Calypogeia fissa]
MAPSQGSSYRGEVVKAGVLWLVGFKEACQIHRAISFCRRSRPVLKKTCQCFVLNGCLFLGSILILRRFVVPTLRYFLGQPVQLPREIGLADNGDWTTGLLPNILIGVCYVFWLFPLYMITFIVNIIWYNDIAKHAFRTMGNSAVDSPKVPVEVRNPTAGRNTGPAKDHPGNKNGGGLQSTMLQIGEQIYSVIMVSVFFLEVFAVTYVPYLGPLLNFVLLSWLYAYYCFDYKWGFSRWSLEKRLYFFETNWAFFAGFGSPCVLATFFLSPLISAGVMNVLFPLFVLVATASNPEEAVQKCIVRHNLPSETRRLPIFRLANNLMLPFLEILQSGGLSRFAFGKSIGSLRSKCLFGA